MSTLIVPAPLWRRLLAGVYDGLLLLGLWLAAAVLEFLIRDRLLGLPLVELWMKSYFFLIGFAFFGWFWTHGGQTLGMRAWRLSVRRLDGSALRWPVAALRFGVMLLTWAAALMPLIMLIPAYARAPRAQDLVMICVLFLVCALTLMLVESRRRAPCDWVSGTEVVQRPRKGESPSGQ
ncbi:MAG: RDD family protein [Panacagrimonas sp.]